MTFRECDKVNADVIEKELRTERYSCGRRGSSGSTVSKTEASHLCLPRGMPGAPSSSVTDHGATWPMKTSCRLGGQHRDYYCRKTIGSLKEKKTVFYPVELPCGSYQLRLRQMRSGSVLATGLTSVHQDEYYLQF